MEEIVNSYYWNYLIGFVVGSVIVIVLFIAFLIESLMDVRKEHSDFKRYIAGETRRVINEGKLVDRDEKG